MDKFVSEDKMTIKLPIPLGTTVYGFTLKCCDACLFQKTKFNNTYPPSKYGDRCNSKMPCHTRFGRVTAVELTFESMKNILKGWGVRFFETKEEAMAKGEAIANRHANQMKSMGFNLDENNYCIKEENKSSSPIKAYWHGDYDDELKIT
ncbi:hypothetical protein [Thomasclavelia cocleata]|uniref:hypothetical protein n=1 Tax=Thomasclavelia cocleata TaxID=69824 RepID=UPI00256F3E54|nr:hypothetical protein [Thomasclavelia cocleata]